MYCFSSLLHHSAQLSTEWLQTEGSARISATLKHPVPWTWQTSWEQGSSAQANL